MEGGEMGGLFRADNVYGDRGHHLDGSSAKSESSHGFSRQERRLDENVIDVQWPTHDKGWRAIASAIRALCSRRNACSEGTRETVERIFGISAPGLNPKEVNGDSYENTKGIPQRDWDCGSSDIGDGAGLWCSRCERESYRGRDWPGWNGHQPAQVFRGDERRRSGLCLRRGLGAHGGCRSDDRKNLGQKAKDGKGHAACFRRQDRRRDDRSDAGPLARSGYDSCVRGRQACLRGETVLAQYS